MFRRPNYISLKIFKNSDSSPFRSAMRVIRAFTFTVIAQATKIERPKLMKQLKYRETNAIFLGLTQNIVE
jgi:hypothetical protein